MPVVYSALADFSIADVVAVARGGSDDASSCTVSCGEVNQKQDHMPQQLRFVFHFVHAIAC